jgi:DNA (cytosine-5)-methyltransferase 1
MEKIIIFKLGELFCGPGGLALGAGLAKDISRNGKTFSISHVWGVDKDPAAIQTYINNVVSCYGGRGICMDATKFCRKEIERNEKISALAFGFPCNDFSSVGKKKGVNGKFGNLYKAGIKVINKYNPHWFVAENVSGIHSADSGNTFRKILHELENSGKYGYTLTVHLYKFEYYGVPQYRHRYIIVGIRKDHKKKFLVPIETHDGDLKPFINVREATQNISPAVPNSELTIQQPQIVMRLKFTPPWHNAWYLDKLLEMPNGERREVLKKLPWYKNEFSELTDDEIIQKIEYARLKCKKARMSHIYKRLDGERPAYTITGSGGGGTHVYHWCEHRALTNRERARIQSFPDTFEFFGEQAQVRKLRANCECLARTL